MFVNSNDGNKVVDAADELSTSVKDDVLDMVVLTVANTVTFSTAIRSSQELIDVRDDEFFGFLCWWIRGDDSVTGNIV